MIWLHQISVVSGLMAIPAALGYYLDDRWGTLPVLTSLFAMIGFGMGMQQLLKIARKKDRGVRGDGKHNQHKQ